VSGAGDADFDDAGFDDAGLRRRWFPVCNSDDLQERHILETELLGHELAIWRAAGGNVNVWANRCPHRGMRLTVGVNLGRELRCAYHGYRFADGSGSCNAIPAQPDRTPPRSLCVRTYPVRVAGSLVWTRLADDGFAADPPLPGTGQATALYRVTVNSPAIEVGAQLAQYRFRPSLALDAPASAEERCSISQTDAYSFQSVASVGQTATELRLFLQPVDAHCTVVHGILLEEIPAALRLAALRHHALALTRLRDACERLAPAASHAAASSAGAVDP